MSDAFLSKEELEKPEAFFPLDLYFCNTCTLVQLGIAVDPDLLFRNYVYMTGTNARLRKSFQELVDAAVTRYGLTSNNFAIDIGSNDGTLLKNYERYGIRTLGIDPSSVAAEAQRSGIPTIVDYFTEDVAKKVRQDMGSADIITATNVFAHVRELDSLMKGVLTLLCEKGVFITESGYVLDMMENMEYDCIYHEHLRYYSVSALSYLFNRYGLEIISVERTVGSSGGSIRVSAARIGTHTPDTNTLEILEKEKERGLFDIHAYQAFAKRVEENKHAITDILDNMKKKGTHIVGVGAPAKGNTLLNYCKIGTDSLEYLAETNPLKIGLYSPGMHIPVVNETRIFEEQPGAALLLAWNYADILMPKLREKGFRGIYIIPNPVPHIVS